MISTHAIQAASWTRFRVAFFCAAVLLVEGYDIAAVGYVVPLLVDAWRVPPAAFTSALAAGNIGLFLGSLIAGLLGDRLGRKPVMIACVSAFGILSLVSAFVTSPTQLAMVRVLTGLGLGGAFRWRSRWLPILRPRSPRPGSCFSRHLEFRSASRSRDLCRCG
jgi:MFS family permease